MQQAEGLRLNEKGKAFIQYYFETLEKSNLSDQEQLTMIDFAVKTIMADDQIEYYEIKFFKNIRHRLSLSDQQILSTYPELEDYLEADIITDSFLNNITAQFIEESNIPTFSFIKAHD